MIVFIRNKSLVKKIYTDELPEDVVAQREIRLQAQVNEFVHTQLMANNITTLVDENITSTYFDMAQIRNNADFHMPFNSVLRDKETYEHSDDEDLQEILVPGDSIDSRASFDTQFWSTKQKVRKHTAKAIDNYNKLTKPETKGICNTMVEITTESSVLSVLD